MRPGEKPSPASARSSWRTSGPKSPMWRSRCIGTAPGRTKTGGPSTGIATSAGAAAGPQRRPRPGRARDEAGALLDLRRAEDDGLRRAVADGAADDDLAGER